MKNGPTYNPRRFLLALALSLAVAGCAMTFDANSLGVPAGMASPAQQPAVGDTFNVQVKALYLLWGAIPSRVPSLERTLEGQLAGGRSIQGLSIRVYHRWSDVLVTLLTVGILDPVSVRFHGVIVGGTR